MRSRLPWTQPEWLAEASAWIRARVDVTVARGIAWDRMVSAREPEFVDEDGLTGPAYGIKLFLAGGPIGTWQEP